MPSTETRLAKAQSNYEFLKFINKSNWAKSNSPDWYITVMFYISVQVVDAYLAKTGKHPNSHNEREEYLDTTLGVDNLTVTSHKELARLSRIARYISKPGEITAAQVLGQDIKDAEGAFTEIRRFCKAECGRDLK